MGFSVTFRDAMLEYAFGQQEYALPTVWLGLSTVSPGADGSAFDEVPLANGYSRLAINNVPGEWTAASSGAISNANALTFPTAEGSWGEIFGYGLFDAATGGNLLAWADLQNSKPIGDADTASFGPGALDFSFI